MKIPTPPAPPGAPLPKRKGFLQQLKERFKSAVKTVKAALTVPAPVVGGAGRKAVPGKPTPYTVKQKLGSSFHTRQLSKNTRAARIASLTEDEYDIARLMGWIGRRK